MVNHDLTYTPGPDLSVANFPLASLAHLRRLTYEDHHRNGTPKVPFWWDCWVAFDIENTILRFVENIVRSGGQAVTLYQPLTFLRKYAIVIERCKALRCAIVTARDPVFERKVWWVPDESVCGL